MTDDLLRALLAEHRNLRELLLSRDSSTRAAARSRLIDLDRRIADLTGQDDDGEDFTWEREPTSALVDGEVE